MSTREKTTDQPQEPAGCELSASAGSPLSALAKSVTENLPDAREAELILEALRWKEDMEIFPSLLKEQAQAYLAKCQQCSDPQFQSAALVKCSINFSLPNV